MTPTGKKKLSRTKESAKSASKAPVKTTARSNKAATKAKPKLEGVLASGICRVEKRGGKNYLRVLSSAEEAVFHGIPEEEARAMFAGWFGASNCVLSFGWWVSCDGSDDCAVGTKCELQKWDKKTKNWVIADGWEDQKLTTFRCKCV